MVAIRRSSGSDNHAQRVSGDHWSPSELIQPYFYHRTIPSSSLTSPSSKISCPSPSLTNCAAMLPITATHARPHHPNATIPMSRPFPNIHPNRIGPNVLVKLDTDCPMPCVVPRTDGCGQQLLMRIAVHGKANVLASTWTNSTTVIAIHTSAPETPAGGIDVLGTRLRKGAMKYATGNSKRKIR
jgi:hypothetical protein